MHPYSKLHLNEPHLNSRISIEEFRCAPLDHHTVSGKPRAEYRYDSYAANSALRYGMRHPKRKDKYLIEGQVWIDAADFGIARVQGAPAKRPSFWLSNVAIDKRMRPI